MEALARGAEREAEELLRGAEPRPLRWRGFRAALVATRTRRRLRTGGTGEYVSYRVTIPRRLVEEMGLEEGMDLGVLVAPLKWYHLADYSDTDVQRWFWSMLPPYARAELCALEAAPEQLCRQYRTVTVIASEEELRELRLEPGQPVTLRELLERAQGLAGRGESQG